MTNLADATLASKNTLDAQHASLNTPLVNTVISKVNAHTEKYI